MEPDAPTVTVSSPAVAVWRPWVTRGLRWLSFVAAIAPLAIMMIGGGAFGMEKPAAWSNIVGTSWVTSVAALILSLVPTMPLGKYAASVIAGEHGVDLVSRSGKKRAVAASEIEQAAIVATPSAPGIALDLSGGRSMSLRTPSVEDAQRLIAAIGPAAQKARYRLSLPSHALDVLGGFLTFIASFIAMVPAFEAIKRGGSGVLVSGLWTGIVASLLFLFFWLTSRPTVEVGADGVAIRERLGERFVPFRDIQSTLLVHSTLTLVLGDGREERVKLARATPEQLAALGDRLSRALAAAKGGASDGARSRALDRLGRSLTEWRAHLGALLSKGPSYRTAALTPEEASTILAAGDASPEHRLGAALALSTSGAPGAKEKIRVAAQSCVNPRLRVALSGLSEEGEIEEEAISQALEDTRSSR